jgi:hypothetical protein
MSQKANHNPGNLKNSERDVPKVCKTDDEGKQALIDQLESWRADSLTGLSTT